MKTGEEIAHAVREHFIREAREGLEEAFGEGAIRPIAMVGAVAEQKGEDLELTVTSTCENKATVLDLIDKMRIAVESCEVFPPRALQ